MAKPQQAGNNTTKQNIKKGATGAVLALTFGPWLKRTAEAYGASLPPDHPFRTSEILRTGFPAATSFVENLTDDLPPLLGGIARLFLDTSEAFQTSIDITSKGGAKPNAAAAATVKAAGYNLLSAFLKLIPERLKKATDKEQEFQDIMAEVEVLRRLEIWLRDTDPDATPKVTTPPPLPARPFVETFQEGTENLRALRLRIQEAAASRRRGF
jgi:hypothetical protein